MDTVARLMTELTTVNVKIVVSLQKTRAIRAAMEGATEPSAEEELKPEQDPA